MKGIDSQTLTEDLHKVPPEHGKAPSHTVQFPQLEKWDEYFQRHVGRPFNLVEDYRDLPLEIFSQFSFDEQCKLVYTRFPFSSPMEKLFRTDPSRFLVLKIKNSMWRWGATDYVWNEVVEAYDHLRRFHFSDNQQFEIRLDHASHHNQYGYSTYHRIYVDGAFAYFVYYKGAHVLTIGFSIAGGKKILIQQVQSPGTKGNRALYKLPTNRVEHVINLFKRNFPEYQLSLVTGESLAQKSISQYSDALLESTRIYERLQNSLSREPNKYNERALALEEKNRDLLIQRIAHIKADTKRIVAIYTNTGSFKLGEITHKGYQLNHREILT